MIQKSTIVLAVDSCGVELIKTFHIYRGFHHKCGKVGNFIRASVKKVKSVKNKQIKKPLIKGKKTLAFIVRTKFKNIKKDGSYIITNDNSAVLLKKRMTPRGKELFGPIVYGVRRRKFRSSFSCMI